MQDGSSEILSSIQILRGIAATMVVLYHLPDLIGLPSPTLLSGGVDLFFVISGFVITISSMGKRDDVRGFIWKRLLRIVPLYWLVTLVAVLIWSLPSTRPVRLDELMMSLLFIPYLDTASGYLQPLLAVGWTLNLELFFYALFAATMFLRPAHQFVALTLIFALLAAAKSLPGPWGVFGFYMTPLLLEFAAGMALALALPRLMSLPQLAGAALLLAGAVTLLLFGRSPDLPRELAQGLPAVLIVAGAVAIEPWLRSRPLAPLHALGDASYALYLTHLLVLAALRPVVVGWPWWAAAALMLAACIVVAQAMYRLVEQPLLRWARTIRPAQSRPAT